MNDKCAAGTGRFLQNMAVMLGCGLEEFSSLPDELEPHPISSMCTVFAESEIVGLLAKGIDRRAIMLGILDSVASRAEGMLRRVGFSASGGVAFTGGAARSRNLVRLIEKRLACRLCVDERSQYAGALGAAETARRQARQDGAAARR
jgi:predicted CoA-substrate-specific enzyme activase